jgi:Ser/Thr protein kinase RdoA (MazF antagonist)
VNEQWLAAYDIGTVQDWRHLEGGMFLKPVLVTTDVGKFVLRRHTFRATESGFRFQAETLDFLAQQGVRCPRVLRDRWGRWGQADGDAFWALHEFLDGDFFDWQSWQRAKSSAEFLRGVGSQVARIHAVLAQARPTGDESLLPALPPIQFDHLEDIRQQWRADLQRLERTASLAPRSVEALTAHQSLMEEHEEWLREQVRQQGISQLPRQLVHGDVSPVNMVFDDTRAQFGLIDWDCLHRGWRIYDALSDVLNRPPVEQAESADFNEEEIVHYLKGYQEATAAPLLPEELRAVLPLCLARQLEDLRQRVRALPSLPSEKDLEYAVLIRGRVRMMNQMRAAACQPNHGSQFL